MGKAILNKIKVSEDIFNDILGSFPSHIVEVKDLNEYIYGYTDKLKIYYDGSTNLIVQKYRLVKYFNEKFTDGWKQIWVTLDAALSEEKTIHRDIYGSNAYNYVMKIIKSKYTKEEIEEQFNSHSIVNNDLPQYHHTYSEFNKIYQFNNCVAYDINGAHADALSEIFPKCREEFTRMHNDRKIKPENKAILNYSVGMLVKRGYRSTYNWIVNRTTKLLLEGIKSVTGNLESELIYSNTDSFYVRNPSNKLEISDELGKLKLEAEGTIYFYRKDGKDGTTPYFVYQYYNNKGELVTKGNLPVELKKYIDLKNNKVITYNKVKTEHRFEYNNIKEIYLDEENSKKIL